MNPKVSVITVVYNGEKYLEQTILSVINQEFKNIEYIIVDGGSTDGTMLIVEKYRDHIHQIVSEKDNGLSDAMNKGIKMATGEWLLYLHADDVFTDPKSLDSLVKSAIRSPESSWITGYLQFQNSENEIFKKDDWHGISWGGMLIRNIIRHQATMVKKSVMDKICFREDFKYAMDYDFFLRVWSAHGNPVIVKKHIVNFRLDGRNLSSNYYASLKDEMKARIKFRQEHAQQYKLPFDYCVYMLRYLKVKFIHTHKNVR